MIMVAMERRSEGFAKEHLSVVRSFFEHGFLAGRKVLCEIGGVREPCTAGAVQMVGGREPEKHIDRWSVYFRISQISLTTGP
jgi:hypothetical protein